MKDVFIFTISKNACICFLKNPGVCENAMKFYKELGTTDASFLDAGHRVSPQLQDFIKESLTKQYVVSTVEKLLEDLKLTVDFWNMKNGSSICKTKLYEKPIGVWDLRGHPLCIDDFKVDNSVNNIIGSGLQIDTPVEENFASSLGSTNIPVPYLNMEHTYVPLELVLEIYAPNTSIIYCKTAKRTFVTQISEVFVHDVCEGVEDFHLVSSFFLDDEHLDAFKNAFHCKSCYSLDIANKKFDAFKTLYGLSKDTSDENDDYNKISRIADSRFTKYQGSLLRADYVEESVTDALGLPAERYSEVLKMTPNYLRDTGFFKVTVDNKDFYEGVRDVVCSDFCEDTTEMFELMQNERKYDNNKNIRML